MNLSEDTIKHLEKKAFLRGLERAWEIAEDTSDELYYDKAERSGAKSVSHAITAEVEKLQEELEGQQYEGGLNFPAGS